MRITKKGLSKLLACTEEYANAMYNKLSQLEDLMEKYHIDNIEQLERIIINDGLGEQAFKEYVDINVKPYKDIEDELGIDLIALFKIYKNGFAFKDEKNKIKQLRPEDLLVACIAIQPEYKRILSAGYYWYFKDYGKTWALTKEELEDE